jgi:mRNA turnover protein 4
MLRGSLRSFVQSQARLLTWLLVLPSNFMEWHQWLGLSVALTKTTKRATRDHKSQLIQSVRDALEDSDRCTSVYVLGFPNLRSSGFQQIRAELCSPSSGVGDDDTDGGPWSARIFLGKLSLLQLALGRTVEDEYRENLHHVSKLLAGEVGLLLTNRPHSHIESYFAGFRKLDYARAGYAAPRDVTVSDDQLSAFPSSMLEPLRKLGAPVEMKVGKIVFQSGTRQEEGSGWLLCREGQTLTPEQCKLLQQFEVKLAEFRVIIRAWWKDGEFYRL